ncbi:hypothetical protein [Paenibacillus sp. FSL W8-0194]|uniref:hypothetical protein n=1 Tax=Paenibacillus sp. FSL W8-0194 TaxID=2921711 RepID=UPI0030D9FBB7
MSTELSRVKTYKSRKKNARKKPPLPAQDGNQPVAGTSRRERLKTAGATLSRVKARKERSEAPKPEEEVREQSAPFEPTGSFRSRSARHKAGHERVQNAGGEEDGTPSRTDKYTSRKIVVSKYFTNSLFFLFLVLTMFLVYWGVKGAPPLEDLW